MRSILLVTLVALAVPATASAATIEVTTADQFKAAGTNAATGDVIHVAAGVYATNVDVKNAGVTIRADQGALLANAAGATGPTLTFSASSGTTPDAVTDLAVVNTVTGGTGAPAVQVGIPGLTLQRVEAVSAKGDAVSSAAAGGSSDRVLNIDSSVLVAQATGAAALRVTSANPVPLQPAGATQVNAHHVTAIGDSSVIVDASGAAGALLPPPGTASGSITATFLDSILLGKRSSKANTDPTSAPNTAKIDTGTRDKVADTQSEAATLFVNPAKGNYHLRADAPVIGNGQFTSGESDKDIDGQPRATNNVSDYGADEFVDRAPKAALAASAASVRQNQPVTLDASKSADPDVGDAIVSYKWDFGDGQTATTTTPTTTHSYTGVGSADATVTVVDREGTASDPAKVTVAITDGIPPTVKVLSPFSKQKITAYNKRKRRVPVQFFGTAADDRAIGKVFLALRPVKKAAGAKCRWFDGKSKLTTAACTAPKVFEAKLDPTTGRWSYRLSLKAKLPKGLYYLYAVPVDASGLSGSPLIVKFRIR
jgi:hypothetical protein